MTNRVPHKAYRIAFAFMVLLLLFYIARKAAYCPITNDEAYSFRLVRSGDVEAMMHTANTHWLNSLGIWIFSTLYHSDAPFFIRLQNLIAFILYAWGVYRCCLRLQRKAIVLAAIALLLLNPYVLDYFAMARGYGMALAFLLPGLMLLFDSFESARWSKATGGWCWMALAVLSNYTSFYLFFFVACYQLFIIWRSRHLFDLKNAWKPILVQTLIIAGISLLAVLNLLEIRRSGDLGYGGDESIFESFFSILSFSSYGRWNAGWTSVLAVAGFLVLLAAAVAVLRRHLLQTRHRPLACLALVIVGTTVLFEALHLLAGTPFLYNRTALVLYLVYSLFLLFVLQNGATRNALRCDAIALFFSGLMIVGFRHNASDQYFYDWRDAADATRQLNDLADLASRSTKKPVVFLHENYGIYENYYRFLHPGKYPFTVQPRNDWNPLEPARIFGSADLALLPDTCWMQQAVQQTNYRLLNRYPVSHTVLVGRKLQ